MNILNRIIEMCKQCLLSMYILRKESVPLLNTIGHLKLIIKNTDDAKEIRDTFPNGDSWCIDHSSGFLKIALYYISFFIEMIHKILEIQVK